MPEDAVARGTTEITADIYRLEVKVGNVRAGLTGGYAPEQLGDVPSELRQTAGQLSRLADELAEHWPKPDPAA